MSKHSNDERVLSNVTPRLSRCRGGYRQCGVESSRIVTQASMCGVELGAASCCRVSFARSLARNRRNSGLDSSDVMVPEKGWRMANVEIAPQALLALFPSRLRNRPGTDELDRLGEFSPNNGNDQIARHLQEMHARSFKPKPWMTSWQDARDRIRTFGEEPPSPYVEWKSAPFWGFEITRYGGHRPDLQEVEHRPDGWMQIHTEIRNDSSQIETYTFLGTQAILSVFDTTDLMVTPSLWYRSWYHSEAGGYTNGSYTEGRVGIALFSTTMDRWDWREEDRAEEQIWSARCAPSALGLRDGCGHDFSHRPEEEGLVTIGRLQAGVRMETFRRYYAFAYFYSQSDADGDHDTYKSYALVLLNGILSDIVVRQTKK